MYPALEPGSGKGAIGKCLVARPLSMGSHSSSSGSGLFERGWTCFYAAVVPEEKWRAGVDLIQSRFLVNVLEFTLVDKRVAHLCLQVGEEVLTVVCTYAPIPIQSTHPFGLLDLNPSGY